MGSYPPPAPNPPGPATVAPQSLQRRAVVQPPAISTALLGPNSRRYPQTPASATPIHTPFSPYASSTSASPPSTALSSLGPSSPMALRASPAMASYNPQEWNRRGPVGGSFMAHSRTTSNSRGTREATGMEADMPSPPPPYSPPPSQSMSQAIQSSPAIPSNAFASQRTSPRLSPFNHSPSSALNPSASSAGPSAYDYRPSSESANAGSPAAAPLFPPPPPAAGRDRSSSRQRPDKQHSVFRFSALTSRNKANEQREQPSSQNAIDSLRQQTSQVLARAPGQGPYGVGSSQVTSGTLPVQPSQQRTPPLLSRPPASRRAASTGAIGPPRSDTDSPAQAWEPGMPLPPPPPGPPPSGARSQSMSRTSDRSTNPSRGSSSGSNAPALAAPAPRRPLHQASSLGPVPPTPADWVEEDQRNRDKSPAGRGLRIRTPNPLDGNQDEAFRAMSSSSNEVQSAYPSSSSSHQGLSRGLAKRDPSARGIRERRSESRAARERISETQSAVEQSNNPWATDMVHTAARPADLILPSPDGAISWRRKGAGGTPRSGKGIYAPKDGPSSAGSSKPYGDLQDPGSTHSTPREFQPRLTTSSKALVPTPPFSPSVDASTHPARFKPSPAPPPKTLPTPPPQRSPEDYYSPKSSALSVSTGRERPVSHILHTPIDTVRMVAPLQPSRPPSAASVTKTPKPTDQELFAESSIERHGAFVEKESAATTDQERLELFAEFIVNESRLRRDRYSAAFEAMASDILDLTRDMWRSYSTAGKRCGTPNTTVQPVMERKDSMSSIPDSQLSGSPAVSSANYTPITDSESPISGTTGRPRGDSQLWQPCLSPIPSMAVSTVPEEEDSRGRSASRWWEESAGGSHGRGGQKVERSARESKYMGVPREAREYLQWEENKSPSQHGGTPGPSDAPPKMAYRPEEYPPEKVGWHEQETPPANLPVLQYWNHSAPTTPDPYKLDVSRLVTLPPPYPRHHPAVNNNHPELGSIRANLRILGDPEDAVRIKDLFRARSDSLRERSKRDTDERRAELRLEIQDRIRTGEMSFSDAAKAEAEFDATEAQIVQRRVQQEFDMYQKDVMTPLHALLAERVRKASASIDHLRSGLFNDAQTSNPNQTQEEGDEQPELLEKLTLLKWLFESRETIHKDMFELEGERNGLYKSVVVTPYVLAKNQEKVREAESFFARDMQDRKLAFEKDTLRRFEDFMHVIEENVTRGVEDQLSAFWDIAPGLLAVVQKVPSDLDGFEVLIPPQEYPENPSYHDFPLQYLYSLLAHAEKSAYQFIESQTNLLCLLHEVKTGVMAANTRLLETQRLLAGEDVGSVEQEMEGIKEDEETRLTVDLQDKVGLVEGQWREALGKGLTECKDRVQSFLTERGGWDESLQE